MTEQAGACRSRIPALDGLRGLAVLSVIADQVGAASGRTFDDDVVAALLRRLDVGIAILFVVSGFLLYQPFAENAGEDGGRPGVARFWWQRVLRMLPPLWLTIGITFVVTKRSEAVGDWLRHMTLVQPFDFFYVNTALAHLWPISVLAGFVFVVPLFGQLASWRAGGIGASSGRHLVIVALMFGSAFAFNVVQHVLVVHRPVLQWVPAYLDWFGAGILLAVIGRAQSSGTTSRSARVLMTWAGASGTCWSAAAMLWLLSATKLGPSGEFATVSFWQWTVQHLLFGLAAFFVVLPFALDRSERPRTLGRRVPRFLGTISYGMFLWQLPVLLVVQDRFGFRPFGGHFASQLILTTSGAVLCGSASWFLVERPLLRFGSRTDGRRG